jgi:hypothetical protein
MRMEADVWAHGTRGSKGPSQAPRSRRRIRWWWVLLGIVALLVISRVVAVIVVSAEDDPPPVTDNSEQVRREFIINAVTDGHLPPVALRIYPWTGRVDANFIDGPRYGRDIVHVRGDRGPKLQWDLDGDGRISRDERTITEEELYVATMRWRYKQP